MNPFESAKATPEALEKITEVREAFKVVNELISAIPNSSVQIGARELAIAKTNLEQAAMWAIKGISHYNVAK